MTIKLKVLITALCIVVLGGALWGCAPSVDARNFFGEWEFLYGSQSELSEENVTMSKSLGDNVVLTLEDDGTGSLDLYGDVTSVSWSAKSDIEGNITVEGSNPATMTIEDDKLVLSDPSGRTLTFARMQDQSASTS